MITAMNEEGNLEPTVDTVIKTVAPRFADYEVLIIDDGSKDRTAMIADNLARHPCVHVHHNASNRGLHYSFKKGIELATKPMVSWVAGNNIVSPEGFAHLCEHLGSADLILAYMVNDSRGRVRLLISRTLTKLLNALFGLRLKYYTGTWLCRADVLKRIRLVSRGSMIMPEVPIRLIYAGESYLEVALQPRPRTAGKSKTFRVANIVAVITSIGRLFWDLRIAHRTAASAPAPSSIDQL